MDVTARSTPTFAHPNSRRSTASRRLRRGHQRNAGFFGKIQARLSRGQSIHRDIIVLTDNDRYLALMIKKGWCEESSTSRPFPNIKTWSTSRSTRTSIRTATTSLPWQSGMTGIAYNDTLTDPVLSIDELFGNPKLKARSPGLNSMGDALTLVMLSNGDDPSKVTDRSFNAASPGQEAADNKQIRQFTGNDTRRSWPRRPLGGDVVVGRHRAARPKADPLERAKGRRPPSDHNMLIPNGGNVYTASVYMNYVYDPKVQGLMEAATRKRNITGAFTTSRRAALASGEEVRPHGSPTNPLIFPTRRCSDSVHIFDSKATQQPEVPGAVAEPDF